MVTGINVFEFEYEYSLSRPSVGGEASLGFDTPNQGNATTYILEKDKNHIEMLSIYDGGLILHVKQTSSEISCKTNKEFQLQDDGRFLLVSE